jgi:hypothetical protein
MKEMQMQLAGEQGASLRWAFPHLSGSGTFMVNSQTKPVTNNSPPKSWACTVIHSATSPSITSHMHEFKFAPFYVAIQHCEVAAGRDGSLKMGGAVVLEIPSGGKYINVVEGPSITFINRWPG